MVLLPLGRPRWTMGFWILGVATLPRAAPFCSRSGSEPLCQESSSSARRPSSGPSGPLLLLEDVGVAAQNIAQVDLVNLTPSSRREFLKIVEVSAFSISAGSGVDDHANPLLVFFGMKARLRGPRRTPVACSE